MNDTISNIPRADWDLTGEVRIVNTHKMNFCLDSTTDTSLGNNLVKVLLNRRGAQKNQIWKIEKGVNNSYRTIIDSRNKRLLCDVYNRVATSAFFPQDDFMYHWLIEKTTPEKGVNASTCGEYYIKNTYSGKYLTLRNNNDITLEALEVNNRAQVWLLFETMNSLEEKKVYKNLVSPDLNANFGLYYLKRLWDKEQEYQNFTITETQSLPHDSNDLKWQIEYSAGGADNTIKNAGNRLISRNGYAIVYRGDGSYDDQYWFIDLVRTNMSYYIITNRRDGKILKRANVDRGKTITDNYTLYSSQKSNDSQYWILRELE